MLDLPIYSIALERVFTQVITHHVRQLAICAAEPKEGVTTLAFALARRAAAQGKQTLLVDFNLYNPQLAHYFGLSAATMTSLVSVFTQNIQPTEYPHLCVLGAPSAGVGVLEFRDREKLAAGFTLWRKAFDLVIVDCSPLTAMDPHIIPAENIAAVCDATILVVLAGKTVEAKVLEAVNRLQCVNATVLGTVFNDQFNPSLQAELCRQTRRLDAYAYPWMEKVRKVIKRSSLLNADI